MADQTEVIRRQMAETRSDLAGKLEALENQVTDKVQSVTETVSETVQSATEAVHDTVETVKETVENVTSTVSSTVHSFTEFFDLGGHTDRHPWIVFGGSVALGCLAAHLMAGKDDHRAQEVRWSAPPPAPSWHETSAPAARPAMAEQVAPASAAPSSSGQKSWIWDELGRLKGLALGALMGVVRDLASRSLPGELGKRVGDEVDNITTNLGGKPFHGSVFPDK